MVSRRDRLPARVPAALALVLGGCAGGRPARPGPAEPQELVAGMGAGARIEREGGGIRLVTGVPDVSGRLDPIGRCDGVRVVHAPPGADRGPEEEEILFASAEILPATQELAGTIVLRTAERTDHRATVRVDVPRRGSFIAVRVTDLVGSRRELLECSLRHHFVAAGPPQSLGPPLRLTGDVAFRAPFGVLHHAQRALGIVPDLSSLARERRMPYALEVRDGPPGFLATGLMALRREGNAFTTSGAAPEDLREETLRFGHHVFVTGSAEAEPPLDAILRWTWERYAVPVLHAAAPTAGRTLQERSRGILEELAEDWVDVKTQRGARAGYWAPRPRPQEAPGRAAALDAAAGPPREAPEPASFGSSSWLLVTARAADLAGERWRRADLRAQAAGVVELALGAPVTGGLFPTTVAPGDDGEAVWSFSHGSAETSGLFHVSDCAWAATCLLRVAPRIPARRDEILLRCRELGLFLVRNQAHDGSIPAWFTTDLIPKRNLLADDAAETSGAALFLAELAAATGDESFRSGAERAFAAVEARCVSTRRWADSEATARVRDLVSAEAGDARERAVGTLTLARAAGAAFRLHTLTRDARFLARATRILDELAVFQQVWSPPWSCRDLFGGLGETNLDLTWSSARGGEAASLFLDGYEATGSRELLQRAVAAVRALVAAAPWRALRSDGTPQGDALQGGEAAAAVILLAERVGDAVVDVRGGFGEGLEPCRIRAVDERGGRVALRLESDLPASQPIRVTFRNTPEWAARLRLVCNGEDLGLVARQQFLLGVPLHPKPLLRAAFAPPTEAPAGAPIELRATIESPPGEDVIAEVTCTFESGATQVIPLERLDGRTFAGSLPSASLAGRERVECRLAVRSAHDAVVVPMDRDPARTIELTGWTRADCGDDDERWLEEPAGSEVVRFADGREWGRKLAGDGNLTYRIPVPVTALEVDVEVAVTGDVKLFAGGRPPSDPIAMSDPGRRRLRLSLKDRRLWERGTLELAFASATAASPAVVAHVRISPAGSGTPATELGARLDAPGATSGTWYVLVLPLSTQEKPPLHARESLDQHFFGGAEYVMTPPPVSVETSGSVARLLQVMSGARVRVTGKVVPWRVLAGPAGGAEGEGGGGGGRRSAIVGALSSHAAAVRTSPRTDLIVVVDTRQVAETIIVERLSGEDLVELSWPSRFAGVPVCILPDRDARGAILPVGLALRAVLMALTPVLDLAPAQRGAFHELDLLGGATAGHVPPGLSAINLATLGWADRIKLSRQDHRNVLLPSLGEGRQFLDLAHDGLPGRGSLLVAMRAAGPLDRATGVHLLWDLTPATSVRLYPEDPGGAPLRPEFLRIVPGMDHLGAVAHPGSWEQLFAPGPGEVAALTDRTMPRSCTAQGEILWQIPRLGLARGGSAVLDVEYHGRELVEEASRASWSSGFAGPRREDHPLAFGGPDRGVGSAGRADLDLGGAGTGRPGLAVRPRSGDRGSVRSVFPLGGASRLFGRVVREAARTEGRTGLRVGTVAAGVEEVLFDLPEVPGEALEFVADIPAPAADGRLFLEWIADGDLPPPAACMDRLLLVPALAPLARMHTLPPAGTVLAAEAARLQDGRAYSPVLRIDPPRERKTPVLSAFPVALPETGGSMRLELGFLASAASDAEATISVRFEGLTSGASETILPPVMVRRSEPWLPFFWLDLARVRGRVGRIFVEARLGEAPLHVVQAGIYPQ